MEEEPLEEVRRAIGDADALRRHGLAELRAGVVTRAAALLHEAASVLAPVAPDEALAVLIQAVEAATYAGDIRLTSVLGRQASALRVDGAPGTETARRRAYVEGLGRMLEGDVPAAAPLLREAMAAGRRASHPLAVLHGGIAASVLGADSAARALHARAVERARADGDLGLLARALEFLVIADLSHGRYEAAVRHAYEGRALAEEVGNLTTACQHTAGLALISALRGRPEQAREHAAVALAHGAAHGVGLARACCTWALAIAELSESRAPQALERLKALATLGPGEGHPIVSLVATPHLVESAARVGDVELAQRALATFRAFALRGGHTWSDGLVARGCALASSGLTADAHFGRAVLLHARAARPFERARTELLWGQALRREGRSREAVSHLRAALDAFERLDSGTWTAQARAELRAAAVSTPGVSRHATTERLTPRQREIVELVATGATNREIAARLDVSPRTVDHHLRQVFAKLGISSRAELIRPAAEAADA
ncbi:MAG TPA: LuxR C-terminal-related transcriptional regulator [Baekduia sp.]|nr:LuxR C-terminal-related transcriptional regulator [Baekduia sp.]